MLSTSLTRTPAEAMQILRAGNSARQVAIALEIPERQLLYVLYERGLSQFYVPFTIPKKGGGERQILAPKGTIAILQQKVLSILAPHYSPPSWVHGFVSGKSICTNARQHTKRRYVVNLDIKDFYDSVNFGRVRGVLQSAPFKLTPNVATVIAQIVTFKNRLPQGACTSPLLANLVAWGLDRKLLRVAKAHKLTYSRYADDITFSTSRKTLSDAIVHWVGQNPVTGDLVLGKDLIDAVTRAGFKVNERKTRVQIPAMRQEVTGLTVNEFINVERSFVRKVRALLHSWRTRQLLGAEAHHIEHHVRIPQIDFGSGCDGSYFRSVVYGCMAYIKQVRGENDRIYLKLCGDIALLDLRPPKFIREGKDKLNMYDFFICHASEDKESIVRPLATALEAVGAKVFVDEKYIKLGDSFVHKINDALGRSRHVIAVISDASYRKHWPATELRNVLAMEASQGSKLLPIMVGSDSDAGQFLRELPLLSERVYHRWDPTVPVEHSIKAAADKLMDVL